MLQKHNYVVQNGHKQQCLSCRLIVSSYKKKIAVETLIHIITKYVTIIHSGKIQNIIIYLHNLIL